MSKWSYYEILSNFWSFFSEYFLIGSSQKSFLRLIISTLNAWPRKQNIHCALSQVQYSSSTRLWKMHPIIEIASLMPHFEQSSPCTLLLNKIPCSSSGKVSKTYCKSWGFEFSSSFGFQLSALLIGITNLLPLWV